MKAHKSRVNGALWKYGKIFLNDLEPFNTRTNVAEKLQSWLCAEKMTFFNILIFKTLKLTRIEVIKPSRAVGIFFGAIS